MKRRLLMFIAVMLTLACLSGCGPEEAMSDWRENGKSPILFQSGNNLYFLAGQKPVMVMENYVDATSQTVAMPWDNERIVRLSPDGKHLALVKPREPHKLYLADTTRTNTRLVTDRLSAQDNGGNIGFDAAGSLYYIRDDCQRVTTDLCRYRDGEETTIDTDIESFSISKNRERLLYHQYQSLGLDLDPVKTQQELYINIGKKFDLELKTMKLYDPAADQKDVIIEGYYSNPNYDEEDMHTISFEYRESYDGKITNYRYVNGVLSTAAKSAEETKATWPLSDTLEIRYEDGYYLYDGETKVGRVGTYTDDALLTGFRMNFFMSADGTIFYYMNSYDGRPHPLYSFQYRDGKIVNEREVQPSVNEARAASCGGIYYRKVINEDSYDTEFCHLVDGKEKKLDPNLDDLYTPGGAAGVDYFEEYSNIPEKKKIYEYKGGKFKLVSEGYDRYSINNGMIYFWYLEEGKYRLESVHGKIAKGILSYCERIE